ERLVGTQEVHGFMGSWVHGPMGRSARSSYGVMDLWTYGPMDLCTYEPLRRLFLRLLASPLFPRGFGLRGGRRPVDDEDAIVESRALAGSERKVQLVLAVAEILRPERVRGEQAVASRVPVGRVAGIRG